jgi:hypothetical protein
MGYFITRLYADPDDDVASTTAIDRLKAMLDELERAEDEEMSVVIGHTERDGSLSIFQGGFVIWGGRGREELYMEDLSSETVLRIARLVASGDESAVGALPWKPREVA